MATHSSVLAWRILGAGEPGGLPSMGSHRVRQDWSDLAAAAKYVQTIIQLNLFHILARLCSKSFKLEFSSTWTKNFQMCKLGFQEAEESEIKLPTFFRSWRTQKCSRKTFTSASMTTLKPFTLIWITTNCEKFFLKGMEILDHLTCLLRNLYADQEATVRTRHGTIDWFKVGKGVWQGCVQ